MKMKRMVCAAGVILAAVLCGFQAACSPKEAGGAVFDWRYEETAEHSLSLIAKASEKLPISRIYKFFSSDQYKDGTARDYCVKAAGEGLEVWAVDGGPQWGMEGGAQEMQAFIEDVALSNRSAQDRKELIKGVVLDVATYSLKEWDIQSEDARELYRSNMEEARRLTLEEGLKTSICIPNWLDEKGYDGMISDLAGLCDELLIMNYRCGEEYGAIERELQIAAEKDIVIASAFEFGEIGTHDLTEKNTYADKGIDMALDAWNLLQKEAAYKKLDCAWHSLSAIETMLEREEEAPEALEVFPEGLTVIFAGTYDDADCILLKHEEGCILIDTGEKQDFPLISGLLKEQGIRKIDWMILTHPDKDHIGGAGRILEEFEVGGIYLPAYEKEEERLEEVKEKAGEKKIPVTELTQEWRFTAGELQIAIFLPEKETYKKDNDYSLAVLARHGANELFFAGDAQRDRLKELLRLELPESIALYKVSHHGRPSKGSADLIARLGADYAVVTSDEPSEEIEAALQEAGSEIVCTGGRSREFHSDGQSLELIR